MINKYKKLVAVAEDMATQISQYGDVQSIEVTVSGKYGYIELQVVCETGCTYCPEKNQYMLDYDIFPKSCKYIWLEDTQEWETEAQMRLEAEISAYENTMPDLPF